MSNPGKFDARELFIALAHHDVDYVTIGGIAIQAYGGQRLTQDLDVTIAASAENIERLASALIDLDAVRAHAKLPTSAHEKSPGLAAPVA